ncbi:hypothetical protein [Streptomyces decoyicus]
MATETGTPIPHHWMLTLSGRVGSRDATVGSRGVLPLTPGVSRYRTCEQLIEELLAKFQQSAGCPLEHHVVVHFDLQPDQIG